MGFLIHQIVGMSLSKPHTSVTSLYVHMRVYVCLLGPTTYCKFEMSMFEYFTKIVIVKHVQASGSCCQSAVPKIECPRALSR